LRSVHTRTLPRLLGLPENQRGLKTLTKQKILELENIASSMIGDGKKPNVFFVSVKGRIVTITRDFERAYLQWRELSKNEDVETALEDRLTGTIASVQPTEDKKALEMLDDSRHFKYR
jgi:hypothetical protein